MTRKYDDSNIQSIIDYSSRLVGKTFLDVINHSSINEEEKNVIMNNFKRPNYKGGLGVLLEEYYFGYKANSEQAPDFKKVGIELKTSPYEIKKDKSLRAGERLSITMVPFDRPIEQSFYHSDVWNQIEKMLLIYYLRDRSLKSRLHYKIGYSYLFSPPPKDLKIIIDDFNTIVNKVVSGKAHEISESDTIYLGASTKGSTAIGSTKPQFYGDRTPARARGFCFKQSYMTHVLNNYIVPNVKTGEAIIKDDETLMDETFESHITNMIGRYVGKSDYELCQLLDRKYNNNKAQWSDLAYRMLGIKSNMAEEFVKANIVVKAIRIEQNGKIRENMSFPAFKFKELVKETWEDSTLHNYFDETRFLFVVYKHDGKNYILKGSQFWNMPYFDLQTEVRQGWEKVVETIKSGVMLKVTTQANGKKIVRNNLLKASEHDIIHVRPHAQKSYYKLEDGSIIGNGKPSDANKLPDGRLMTTQCFWINNKYILSQINERLKT